MSELPDRERQTHRERERERERGGGEEIQGIFLLNILLYSSFNLFINI